MNVRKAVIIGLLAVGLGVGVGQVAQAEDEHGPPAGWVPSSDPNNPDGGTCMPQACGPAFPCCQL